MSTPAETTSGLRAARYVNRISATLLVLTPLAAAVYLAAQGGWLLAALNLAAVAMATRVIYTTRRRIKCVVRPPSSAISDRSHEVAVVPAPEDHG